MNVPKRTKPHNFPHWTLPVVCQGVLSQVPPLSSLGKKSSSHLLSAEPPSLSSAKAHPAPHARQGAQMASCILCAVSNYCAPLLLLPGERPDGLILLSSFTHLHIGRAALLRVFPVLIPRFMERIPSSQKPEKDGQKLAVPVPIPGYPPSTATVLFQCHAL